jgi:threonine dehydrogenase-like Zn-dependent dehydrogenase
MLESDRPIALRQAIMSCRNGGVVLVVGVYGGFIDKFPMGLGNEPVADDQNRPVPRAEVYAALLERVQKGQIDPSFVITHTLPLEQAPAGFSMFLNKQDDCVKVVLKPQQLH